MAAYLKNTLRFMMHRFHRSYQIDVISNDAFFSDQFINHASKMVTVSFTDYQLIRDV